MYYSLAVAVHLPGQTRADDSLNGYLASSHDIAWVYQSRLTLGGNSVLSRRARLYHL